jgi:hypothetical protein
MLRYQDSSEPKISNLDIHSFIQEDIACLQISMYNISVVKVFDSATGLNNKPSNLRHGEEFAFPKGVGEGAIVAEFENYVGIVSKRKGAVEFDDVWVAEFGMKLEFGHKLLMAR